MNNNNNNDVVVEILFWKIFKSKYLNHLIFSFLDSENNDNNNSISISNGFIKNYGFGKQYFKYDEIIHVRWILDNNYYGLLKLKVKRSDLLVAGKYQGSLSNNQQQEKVGLLSDIISHSRNNKKIQNGGGLDYEFYENLFKNYNQYLNIDQIVELSIQYNKEMALNVLINKPYNYSLTFSDLVLSIVNCNLKCIKLILSNINKQEIESNNNTLKYLSFKKMENIKSLKVILYLMESNVITFPTTVEERLKHYNCFSSDLSIYYNKFNWIHLKLKELIRICKFITMLKEYDDNKLFNNLFEFNKLLLSIFNKNDLKSTLKSLLHSSSIETIKLIWVKKMINLYLSEMFKDFNYNNNVLNYFYNNENEKELIQLPTLKLLESNNTNSNNNNDECQLTFYHKHLLLLSLKHGISKYWINLNFEKLDNDKFDILNFFFFNESGLKGSFRKFVKPKQTTMLFKYCSKLNKEKQIKFINEMSENILNQKQDNENSRIQAFIFLYLVIGTDDLELVKLVIEKLESGNFQFKTLQQPIVNNHYNKLEIKKKCENFYIHYFIQSIEMLNFCYENFKIQFHLNDFKDWSDLNVYRFKNSKLLERFDEIIDAQHNENTSSKPLPCVKFSNFINQSTKKENILNSFGILKYIITKPNKYNVEQLIFGLRNLINKFVFEIFSEHEFNEIILPTYQFIIINSKSSSSKMLYNPIHLFTKQYQIIKLLDWIVLNKLHLEEQCTFEFKDFQISNILNNNKKSSLQYVAIKLIAQNGDIKSLNNLIDLVKSDSISFKLIQQLCEIASEYGQLIIIQHLYSNHFEFLSNKLYSFYNFIKSLTDSAIKQHHLHILDFIFNEKKFRLNKKDYNFYTKNYSIILKYQ